MALFSGKGIFFGVLLHDRKGEKRGGGQMTMIHVNTHGELNIVLCECARHITVVCLLIGRFLGGLSYFGV